MVPWFPPPTPSPTAVADRVVSCGGSSPPQGFGDDAMMDDLSSPCDSIPQPTFYGIMLLWGAALLINSGCIGLVCVVAYRACRTRFSRDYDGGPIAVSPLWPSMTEDVEWAGRRVSLTAGGRAWWESVPVGEQEEADQEAAVREEAFQVEEEDEGGQEEETEVEEVKNEEEDDEEESGGVSNVSQEGTRTARRTSCADDEAVVELQPIRTGATTAVPASDDDFEDDYHEPSDRQRGACVVTALNGRSGL